MMHFLYRYLIHHKRDAEGRKALLSFLEKCNHDTRAHTGFICTPGESSITQKTELRFSVLPLCCQRHKDSSVTAARPALPLACPLL